MTGTKKVLITVYGIDSGRFRVYAMDTVRTADQMELGDPGKKKVRQYLGKSSHQIRTREVSSLNMSQLEQNRQEKETGEGTK